MSAIPMWMEEREATHVQAPSEWRDARADDGVLVDGKDLRVGEDVDDLRRHGGKLQQSRRRWKFAQRVVARDEGTNNER